VSDIFDALDQVREHALQLDRAGMAATAAYVGAAAERDAALADLAAARARIVELEALVSPPAFDEILVPASGVLLGSTFGAASEGSVRSFTQIVGRPPAIAHEYATSAAQFARRLAAVPAGSIPCINLKPLGRELGPAIYRRVLDGEADQVFADVAEHIAGYGRPMFIVPMHEPENDGPASGDALYAEAFRYAVERIRPTAPLAVVVWNPMGWSGHLHRYPVLYPGDDVVDWIGCNPYAQDVAPADFAALIGRFYAWAAPKGKPIMLPEWGVGKGIALQAGIWSAASVARLRADMPLVRALVYWDAIGVRDYRYGEFESTWRTFADLPEFDVDVSSVAKET
jgi:hypothetical protein